MAKRSNSITKALNWFGVWLILLILAGFPFSFWLNYKLINIENAIMVAYENQELSQKILVKSLLLAREKDEKYKQDLEHAQSKFNDNINKLKNGDDAESIPRNPNIASFPTIERFWERALKEIETIEENPIKDIRTQKSNKVVLQAIQNLIGDINEIENKNQDFIARYKDYHRKWEFWQNFTLWASIITSLIATILYFTRMNRWVIRPLKRIGRAEKLIREARFEEKVDYKEEDELGTIADSLNLLFENLENASNFIKNIEEGNLDVEYKLMGEQEVHQDRLGNALLDMRNKMKEDAEDKRQRTWISEGLAKFAKIFQNESENENYTYLIISNLVQYVEANQGALFVLGLEMQQGENDYLEMVAAYAFEKRKYFDKKIYKGEGVIGEVFQEGSTVHLTEVPEDFVNITSGLGDSTPKSILLVPLHLNQEIYGVLELASFTDFASYQIEFVERLGEAIASSFANQRTNIRTQHLLKDSLAMSEQLQIQEAEMKKNLGTLEQAKLEAQEQRTIIQKQVEKERKKSEELAVIQQELETQKDLVEQQKKDLQKALNEQLKVNQELDEKSKEIEASKGKEEEYREQIQKKLREEQALSKKLKENDDELRKKIEELAQVHNIMQEKDIEITGQLDAINLTLATADYDLNGILLDANNIFLEMLDYKEEDIFNKHHSLLVHKDAINLPENLTLWQDLSQGVARSGEFRFMNSKGRSVWIFSTYTPVRDVEGKPYKIIQLANNITEDKRQSLDYEGQIKAIEETTVVFELDIEQNFQKINKNFLDIFKYTEDEILGKAHKTILKEVNQGDETYQNFWNALENREYQTGIYERVDKDGKTVWLRGSYHSIVDSSGRMYKVAVFLQDITKQMNLEIQVQEQVETLTSNEEELRQNAEELVATQEELALRLRQSEIQTQELTALLETSLDVIVLIDSYGIIQEINSVVEKIFGYTREELLKQSINTLMPAQYAKDHDKYLQNYLSTNETKVVGRSRKVRAKHKNGKTFEVEIAVGQFKIREQYYFTGFIRKI